MNLILALNSKKLTSLILLYTHIFAFIQTGTKNQFVSSITLDMVERAINPLVLECKDIICSLKKTGSFEITKSIQAIEDYYTFKERIYEINKALDSENPENVKDKEKLELNFISENNSNTLDDNSKQELLINELEEKSGIIQFMIPGLKTSCENIIKYLIIFKMCNIDKEKKAIFIGYLENLHLVLASAIKKMNIPSFDL